MESVEYLEQGFWSGKPHVCIQRNYQYPETNNYVEQYVIVTEDACQCYNNWNQIYTVESMEKELRDAGFEDIVFLMMQQAGRTREMRIPSVRYL